MKPEQMMLLTQGVLGLGIGEGYFSCHGHPDNLIFQLSKSLDVNKNTLFQQPFLSRPGAFLGWTMPLVVNRSISDDENTCP